METGHDKPIYMLNLLKFKENGLATYMRYGQEVLPLLEKTGGKILYAGHAAERLIGSTAEGWDLVV